MFWYLLQFWKSRSTSQSLSNKGNTRSPSDQPKLLNLAHVSESPEQVKMRTQMSRIMEEDLTLRVKLEEGKKLKVFSTTSA